MSAFQDAVEEARASWLANETTADVKWPLRQLHALYNLLVEHRDEVINALVTDTSLPSLFHERELALVVDDISALIEEVQAKPYKPQVDRTRFGNLWGTLSPCGVSLIVCQSDSPLRHAVAPFASSIAARNTVILGTTDFGRFLELFQRHARESMDASAIHVVQVAQDEIGESQVDHVLIVDEDRSKWARTLANPKAFYCPVVGGFNLAVIGEGPIAPEKLARLLVTADDKSQHKADVLTAVFVHAKNSTALTSALAKTSHQTPIRLDGTAAANSLESQVYTIDLASSNAANLTKLLTSAREARALVLIETTSLDQIIDSARKIGKVKQLALLNPASPKLEAYFQRWTRSDVFTTEGFFPTTPSFVYLPGMTDRVFPGTSFPTSFFSRYRLSASGKHAISASSIEEIRQSYVAKVSPLKPEHPGGRIDFFKQVEYVLKGTGAVLGSLTLVGLYFGAKSLRRRYL